MKSPGAIARRAVYDALKNTATGWNVTMQAEAEQYGIAPLALSFGGTGRNVDIALWNSEDIPESRLVGQLLLAIGVVGSSDQRTAATQSRRFAAFSGPVTVALQFLYRQEVSDVEDLLVERAEFAADAIEGTLVGVFSPAVILPSRCTYMDMTTARETVGIGGDYYYKAVRAEITLEIDIV